MDLSKLSNLTHKTSFDDNYEIIDETQDYIVILKKHGIAVQATDKDVDDLETSLNARYKEKVHVLNHSTQLARNQYVIKLTRNLTQAIFALAE